MRIILTETKSSLLSLHRREFYYLNRWASQQSSCETQPVSSETAAAREPRTLQRHKANRYACQGGLLPILHMQSSYHCLSSCSSCSKSSRMFEFTRFIIPIETMPVEHCLITLAPIAGRPHRGWKVPWANSGYCKFALPMRL